MLKDQIQKDLQQAQLEKDEVKVSTLRLLWSELRYAEINGGKELTDEDVLGVISREIKKRREAAESFNKGGRVSQAEKEELEMQILSAYLPAQLSDEELAVIVDEAIAQTGASSISDMGKVIGAVMGKAAGRVEGARVSEMVKQRLVHS